MSSPHWDSPNREAPNKHLIGSKKYKEMIAKDTKNSDQYKNLPFKISKPSRRWQARREVFYLCLHCDAVNYVTKNTVGTTCSKCRKYNRVEDTDHFSSEDELMLYLEKCDR